MNHQNRKHNKPSLEVRRFIYCIVSQYSDNNHSFLLIETIREGEAGSPGKSPFYICTPTSKNIACSEHRRIEKIGCDCCRRVSVVNGYYCHSISKLRPSTVRISRRRCILFFFVRAFIFVFCAFMKQTTALHVRESPYTHLQTYYCTLF